MIAITLFFEVTIGHLKVKKLANDNCLANVDHDVLRACGRTRDSE